MHSKCLLFFLVFRVQENGMRSRTDANARHEPGIWYVAYEIANFKAVRQKILQDRVFAVIIWKIINNCKVIWISVCDFIRLSFYQFQHCDQLHTPFAKYIGAFARIESTVDIRVVLSRFARSRLAITKPLGTSVGHVAATKYTPNK